MMGVASRLVAQGRARSAVTPTTWRSLCVSLMSLGLGGSWLKGVTVMPGQPFVLACLQCQTACPGLPDRGPSGVLKLLLHPQSSNTASQPGQRAGRGEEEGRAQ